MTDYNKMDPAVKARWVAALRSGKYTQGKGELKSPSGCNCCLGVLAEINEIPREFNEEFCHFDFIFPNGETHGGSVPENYCGIDSGAQNDLINMNDGHVWDDDKDCYLPAKSFLEIADFIDENL